MEAYNQNVNHLHIVFRLWLCCVHRNDHVYRELARRILGIADPPL